MKNITLILSFICLSACGKGAHSPRNNETTSPAQMSELTSDERAFVARLIKIKSIDQKDLIKELTFSKNISKYSLIRLDQHLNVSCSDLTAQCEFSKKDK